MENYKADYGLMEILQDKGKAFLMHIMCGDFQKADDVAPAI